jgi:uncharacterized protein YjbI with pentapeptide repeats
MGRIPTLEEITWIPDEVRDVLLYIRNRPRTFIAQAIFVGFFVFEVSQVFTVVGNYWLFTEGKFPRERYEWCSVCLSGRFQLVWLLVAGVSYVGLKVAEELKALWVVIAFSFCMWTALFIFLLDSSFRLLLYIEDPNSYSRPWAAIFIGIVSLFLLLWKFPKFQLSSWKDKLELKDYLALENSARTTLLQIIGGCVVLVGLYFTALSLNVSQENVTLSLRKAEAERLSQAITQLKDENLEVRMVAIYNLRRLASESEENFKLIREILLSYIRTRATRQGLQSEMSQPREIAPGDIQAILTFVSDLDLSIKYNSNLDRYTKFFIERREKGESVKFEDYDPELQSIDLRDADLRGANLTYAVLAFSLLSSANLEGSHFSHSLLTGADLKNVILRRVDLRQSYLGYAALDDAVLSDSNLSEATLTRASLNNADLKGANLTDADFGGADLNGANLTDADLENADLSKALNLTLEQVKSAKNFDKAKLPTDLKAAIANK